MPAACSPCSKTSPSGASRSASIPRAGEIAPPRFKAFIGLTRELSGRPTGVAPILPAPSPPM